jgi:hypothetical protein
MGSITQMLTEGGVQGAGDVFDEAPAIQGLSDFVWSIPDDQASRTPGLPLEYEHRRHRQSLPSRHTDMK